MFCSIGCGRFTRIQECRRNMNPVVGLRKSQNGVESNQINFSQGLVMTINEYAGSQI